MARILVVEDEPKVAGALKEGLDSEGYDVTLASTGEEGFFHASSQGFDVIILDIMLPGRDGIEILQTLRRQGARRSAGRRATVACRRTTSRWRPTRRPHRAMASDTPLC